jgi:hypothetical protein
MLNGKQTYNNWYYVLIFIMSEMTERLIILILHLILISERVKKKSAVRPMHNFDRSLRELLIYTQTIMVFSYTACESDSPWWFENVLHKVHAVSWTKSHLLLASQRKLLPDCLSHMHQAPRLIKHKILPELLSQIEKKLKSRCSHCSNINHTCDCTCNGPYICFTHELWADALMCLYIIFRDKVFPSRVGVQCWIVNILITSLLPACFPTITFYFVHTSCRLIISVKWRYQRSSMLIKSHIKTHKWH